jgi:hypothetical protein
MESKTVLILCYQRQICQQLNVKILHSAFRNPDIVDNFIKQEVDTGYIKGVFEKPPVDMYCVSLIGIVDIQEKEINSRFIVSS